MWRGILLRPIMRERTYTRNKQTNKNWMWKKSSTMIILRFHKCMWWRLLCRRIHKPRLTGSTRTIPFHIRILLDTFHRHRIIPKMRIWLHFRFLTLFVCYLLRMLSTSLWCDRLDRPTFYLCLCSCISIHFRWHILIVNNTCRRKLSMSLPMMWFWTNLAPLKRKKQYITRDLSVYIVQRTVHPCIEWL